MTCEHVCAVYVFFFFFSLLDLEIAACKKKSLLALSFSSTALSDLAIELFSVEREQ